jgi:hypothetical protein
VLSSLPGSNPGVSAGTPTATALRAWFRSKDHREALPPSNGKEWTSMGLIWTALAIIGLIAVILWVF